MTLSDFKEYVHVPKIWGEEIWLTNSDKYCAKYLILNEGYQCSLHRHLVKDETFFVIDGTIELDVQTGTDQKFKQTIRLGPGENYHIPVGVFHRFRWASYKMEDRNPVVILEVSTRHDDLDVERLEDSREV